MGPEKTFKKLEVRPVVSFIINAPNIIHESMDFLSLRSL